MSISERSYPWKQNLHAMAEMKKRELFSRNYTKTP